MCYNCLVIYLLVPNALLHHPLPYTPRRTPSASSLQYPMSNIQYLLSIIQYSIRGTNAPIPHKNLSWRPFLLRALTNFVVQNIRFYSFFFRETNSGLFRLFLIVFSRNKPKLRLSTNCSSLFHFRGTIPLSHTTHLQ